MRVATADGAAATGAVVEVIPATAATGRSAQVSPHSALVSLPAQPPQARVRVSLTGFQPAECLVTVVPGGVTSVDVQLSRVGQTAASTAVERDRSVVAHQTTFSRPALERLPSAATASSLLETAHPFLISDRIDGGGQWPGEGARLGGQQGSSAAQTTFRLDGHDVGDPLFDGRAVDRPGARGARHDRRAVGRPRSLRRRPRSGRGPGVAATIGALVGGRSREPGAPGAAERAAVRLRRSRG